MGKSTVIFWVLAVVFIAALAIGITAIIRDEGTPVPFFIAALAGILLLPVSMPPQPHELPGSTIRWESHDGTLTSLGDSDAKNGRYYLGYGYSGSYRTINFTVEHTDADGFTWTTIESRYAMYSRVFQDETENPHVTTNTPFYTTWWWRPWESEGYDNYDFHIPAGSVQENFVIDNE